MSFTIAAFVARKPEISPVEFKASYEKHVAVLKEAVGSTYPQSATRHYVKRAKSDPTGETPLSFTGSELTFGYDLIVFFKFENEEKAGEFQAKYAEQQEKIAADVAGFVQLEKFRVIAFEEGIST